MEDRRYSPWMLERIVIGDSYRLRIGNNTFGRHSSSNIRALEAFFISRHHAIFEVSEDGASVAIKDVSSNGIYVNERKYEKATVQLTNNDLIGIGVSPEDAPRNEGIIKVPIYQLKYAPMSSYQIPPVNNLPAISLIKTESEVNTFKNVNDYIKKELDNNIIDQDVQKPGCSKSENVAKISTVDEIFEISDDDEPDVVLKPKSNETDVTTHQKQINSEISSNENQHKLLIDLNTRIDNVIKNETFHDNDLINPSQKTQAKKLHESNNINSAPRNEELNKATAQNNKKIEYHEPTTPVSSFDNVQEPLMHIPILSSIKKERIRSVSDNIKNIFGDIEGNEVIKNAIREINPYVLKEINGSQISNPLNVEGKILTNGVSINLTEDDDFEGIEEEDLGTLVPNVTESNDTKTNNMEETHLHSSTAENSLKNNVGIGTTKSPNIFETSLDSKDDETDVADNPNSKPKTTSYVDNTDLKEYTKYVPNSDDEDIEDIMFSQVIINDMKAELQTELNAQENLPLTNTNMDKQKQASNVIIKQEPGLELFAPIPKELENSCWNISDDEDYDEELEAKVNGWSNKIFSQSFSLLSQNMSQVYEIEEQNKIDDNDNEEEEDDDEEDNLSLLEDDIDGIAEIYNSFQENDIAEKVESFNVEIKNEMQNVVEELRTDEEENMQNINNTNDDHEYKADEDSIQNEEAKNDDLDPIEACANREKSPIIETKGADVDMQSPLIRTRRLSKSKPVIDSASSSEDDLDTNVNTLSNDLMETEKDKPITRLLPPVIEAPALPKHKGKLRGVSAELPKNAAASSKTASVKKTLSTIRSKMEQERFASDLRRKWMEKPSTSKKRDKEHKKYIKECRKDKLKKLAERRKSPSKDGLKRKMSPEGHEHKAKVAKVKVTTQNRGAFLVNEATPPLPAPGLKAEQQANQFKIPKLTNKSDELRKSDSTKEPLTRSVSVDCLETFSQQIAKPDALLVKNNDDKPGKPAPLRKHSARAVRTTNKITFASMEKNIVESEESKRKLTELNAKNPTPMTSSTKPIAKVKKTVRFNETPIIHYIERVTGACKKINYKDIMPLTTYKNRRDNTRSSYPIIDHTNKIISNILSWSNEWLKKRNAAAAAASDIIYPMPTYFNTFEHYQSIILPLMKLEFVSTLEREHNSNQNVKNFKVSLEYSTLNDDRIMLITKLTSNHNKEIMDSALYDLVILQTDKRGPQMFAFAAANRKATGSSATIVYEIIAKNFTIEYFKAIKELYVRPVMDKVRVHFGAFNSVYQLQSTPLFEKIMNPLELLKCRPPPKKKVVYRGFDKLNDKQKQVLLTTYVKIIDESTPNMTLIQGPPGTGKSCVITNLVLQALYGAEVRYLDKKILICAQSNAAVDVIAAKLYDISMRMRTETRFRVIRYGMLNKMHPNVLPIALQKVVENDQLKRLQAKNKNMHFENKENLKTQILQFEAQVMEMSSRNIKGTVEEEQLIEKKRQLQLMRNILHENMRPEDERSLFSWYLGNANIVCATLSSCVNLWQYTDFFDICIIDEATQCTEPWTLLPLKFGINSLVLVGDTQQLPATVLSKKASELGLGTSMFTRIQQCLESVPSEAAKGLKAAFTAPNNIMHSLQTQYRMHPEICRWPNQYFYRNELINDKSTIDFNKSPLVPFSILSLTYTQNNSGANGKITNNLEAEFVAKLLKALDGYIPNKYNSYGVITPYAHHRATLESSIRNLGLTNIMVNTIDSYQGLEKDVIVISNARTNGIGFLSNPQRLNVALTRSKKCLILCGNFKTLESVPSWRCLLESARERKLYHEISANCIEDMRANVIEKIMLKKTKSIKN